MTLLYSDPLFLRHETGKHPERAERLRQVTAQLSRTGLDQRCRRPCWQPATAEQLRLVHDAGYIDSVASFAQRGGGRIEPDTVMSAESDDVARQASGAVADAVARVVGGDDRQALCLVRPPGHHALHDAAMGFCLFNHIAVGARVAVRQHALDRVLVVDWDVHHGNGTQNMFWEDGQVAFLSIHRWPFYPGTGRADDTGSGRGLGWIRNLPTEMGTSRRAYLDRFAAALDKLAAKVKPQLVLISAGFDSHRDDPVGSLGLETEDYEPLTNMVLDVAEAHAGGRVVSVLEGGYNPGILAGCLELHLRTMLTRQEKAAGQPAKTQKDTP
jgi:acetoin utilization deacetylase AcuC-like enzyme